MTQPTIKAVDRETGDTIDLGINDGTVTATGQWEGQTDTSDGGVSLAEIAYHAPDTVTVNLPQNNQYEQPVDLEPGETLSVHRWGAKMVSDGTVPAGLEMRILDDTDTVVASEETRLSKSVDTPVASYENTSDTEQVTVKIQAHNGTGGDLGVDDDADGVGIEMGWVVS
jgi:hypothetical protein